MAPFLCVSNGIQLSHKGIPAIYVTAGEVGQRGLEKSKLSLSESLKGLGARVFGEKPAFIEQIPLVVNSGSLGESQANAAIVNADVVVGRHRFSRLWLAVS